LEAISHLSLKIDIICMHIFVGVENGVQPQA
jgi:hypothetical protein